MTTAIIIAVLCAIAGWFGWFIFFWLPNQKGDTYEDGAQSDADVEQIKESTRGTL